jgi:hypothetical protein
VEPTQPSIQLVPGALSLGVKRPECEADYNFFHLLFDQLEPLPLFPVSFVSSSSSSSSSSNNKYHCTYVGLSEIHSLIMLIFRHNLLCLF